MPFENDFLKFVDSIIDDISEQTGFPVLIYDHEGCVVRSSHNQPIGKVNSKVQDILLNLTDGGTITQGGDGYACPLVFDGKPMAAIGIHGKLEIAKPLARATAKMLQTAMDDITAKKEAENTLRTSEEKYFKAFNNSPVWVVLSSMDSGRYIEVNESFLRTMGYQRDDIIGRTANDIQSWEDEKNRDTMLEQVKKDGFIRNFEVKRRTKKGNILTTLFSAEIIEVSGEACLLSVSQDITEQKKWQQTLAASERRFRDLFDEAPVIYIITETRNNEPHIQYVNNMFSEVLGYSRKEVIGTPLKHYYTKESVKMMLELGGYERALKGLFTAEERTFINRKGEQVHTLLHSLPEVHSDGHIGTRAMFVDITARKKAEDQAKHLEAALAQSQKMEAIGTLAGGIAHDFNNILSAVIGFSEISLNEVSKDSRLYRNLEQILTAGVRARDLVRQILTFSRQTEKELKPLQLEPVIKEALKLLRSTFPSTIEISQQIDPDLDNVMADPIQIQQIFMNLCTNAVQSMAKSGGLLNIILSEVDLKRQDYQLHPNLNPGRYIKLSVEDTGEGIPQEIMDKIYHPYFTTKDKGEGTGLGLSVVHGIVQSYGGAIKVESISGHGTSFNVYIPAIKRPALIQSSDHADLPTGDERILFVDDEPNLVELGQEILEMLGYQVIACNDSLSALEAFHEAPHNIDLVISDVTMPKMTGDRLAAQMLKKRPGLPIILCTGFNKNLNPKMAKEIGIRRVIAKPLILEQLAKLVRATLDGTDT